MKKTTVITGARRLLTLGLVLSFMCTATACTNSAKNNNDSDSMAGSTTGNDTGANGNGDTAAGNNGADGMGTNDDNGSQANSSEQPKEIMFPSGMMQGMPSPM